MVDPPAVLRKALEDAREHGQAFDDAWPFAATAALEAVPTERELLTWRKALAGTRDAWRDAYAHTRPSRSERAVGAIGRLRELDPHGPQTASAATTRRRVLA